MKLLVLADLHLDRACGRFEKHRARVARLAANFDRVILNGDTLEWCCRPPRAGEETGERLRLLRETFAGRAGGPELLSGNHDPGISEQHFLYLPEAELLVYHGDFPGEGAWPWRRKEREFREQWGTIPALGAATSFPEYAKAYREAQLEFLRGMPRGFHRPLPLAILEMLFPPTRGWRVWRYIQEAPLRAAAAARAFPRPVRHVAVGHTHCPGCWEISGVRVYNLGGFVPLTRPCALVVDGAEVLWKPLRELPGQG